MQHVSKWASAAKVALALVLAIGFVPIVPTTAYATANEKGGGSSETVTKEGTNSVSDDKLQGNGNIGGESAVETQGSTGHKAATGSGDAGSGGIGDGGAGSGGVGDGGIGNGADNSASKGSGTDTNSSGNSNSSNGNTNGSINNSAPGEVSSNALVGDQSESSEAGDTGSQNESEGEKTDISCEDDLDNPRCVLYTQIAAVNVVLQTVVISEDGGYYDKNGNKVTSDQLWISQESYDILKNAVAEAQAIYNDESFSDEEYQDSADKLKSIAESHGVQFGMQASDDTIEQIKDSLFISETFLEIYHSSKDGSDLTDNEWWVTPEVYDALKAAHNNLSKLFGFIAPGTITTQANCDECLFAWYEAYDTFNNNLKRGLLEPESYVDQLESAIYDHQAVLRALVDEAYHLCDEGDDGADVPSDEWWYPQSAVDAYERVIHEAWDIALNDDDLTEQEMLDAIAMLDAAYDNFPEAQLGKRVSEETIIQMGYALEVAEYFLENTSKGGSSEDAYSNEFWVPESIYDDLDNYRAIVQLRYDEALEEGNTVSQVSCDDALESLSSAFEAFTDNMQRGNRTPETPYGQLESALLDHEISFDALLGMAHVCEDGGAHVPSDEFWLPYEDVQNYGDTILQVAQFCEENNESITEEQAKEQIAKLDQAYDAIPEIAPGLRVSQSTLENMELSIDVAQRVLNALHVSNDNGAQLPSTELWVTQEEYDQIAALIENVRSLYEAGSAEYNTVPQADCDAALAALTEATNTLPKKGTMKISEEPTDKTDTSTVVEQASLDKADAAKSELVKTADNLGVGIIALIGGATVAIITAVYALRRFRGSSK